MNILYQLYWCLMAPVRFITNTFGLTSSGSSPGTHAFPNGLFSIAALRQPSDFNRINSLLENRLETVLKREESKSFPSSVTDAYSLVGGLATTLQELTEVGFVVSFVDAFIDESKWRSEWKSSESSAQILLRERVWLPNGLPVVPDVMVAEVKSRLAVFMALSDSQASDCLAGIRSTSNVLLDVSM